MDFAEAWLQLSPGDRVRVSDGKPEPLGGLARNLWRSHNHEGEIVEKTAGPVRSIRVQLDKVDGARVAYDVSEAVEHTFEVV